MAETIVHIFDKVFKKILTLSAKAVINLINGLFGTTYPEDSTITYNWTEFMDTELRRTLADTIITVNGKYSYHIEAQLEKAGDIVFRVFEYGYHHAISQIHIYCVSISELRVTLITRFLCIKKIFKITC